MIFDSFLFKNQLTYIVFPSGHSCLKVFATNYTNKHELKLVF